MNVLVIGNGFDLDLGLDTRYSDFVKDSLWEELKENVKVPKDGLAEYVFQQAESENWFDLEDCLAKYVEEHKGCERPPHLDNDIHFHQQLKSHLLQYLENELGEKCDKFIKESFAYKLLTMNCFTNVFSFNYTWYDVLSESQFQKIEYVHGQWEEDAVLGIGESECLNPNYSFMVKINSPNYPRTSIANDLLIADDVVIFGHSLCERDSGYFIRLFKKCLNDTVQEKQRHITIVTKDTGSIHRIKLQFSKWDCRFDVLNSVCDFSFIATDLLRQGDKNEIMKADKLTKRLKLAEKPLFTIEKQIK